MARRSLRPQLNQIRAWVRQGRTDAWIAHQLEVTVQQIQAFKREQGLEAGVDGEGGLPLPEYDDEIDLRAEDDALIAAELEAAAAARAAEAEAEAAARAAEAEAAAQAAPANGESDDAEEDEDGPPSRRRRSRRGGRAGAGRARRKTATGTLEGTFDHGDEGYGLWLDPAVQDDPVYAEYWAGHRPVEITIEEEQIIIRRAGSGDDEA
jgi:hypothetical protein